MTAQLTGHVMWSPDPLRQRLARHEQDRPHVFACDLVDGRYELAADSARELVLTAPFDIRLLSADITS